MNINNQAQFRLLANSNQNVLEVQKKIAEVRPQHMNIQPYGQ